MSGAEECARRNVEINADIPESEPGKLAALMDEGTKRLLAATTPCDDTQEVLFHCGNVMTIPHLVATALAEHLLHGYDMAVAVASRGRSTLTRPRLDCSATAPAMEPASTRRRPRRTRPATPSS